MAEIRREIARAGSAVFFAAVCAFFLTGYQVYADSQDPYFATTFREIYDDFALRSAAEPGAADRYVAFSLLLKGMHFVLFGYLQAGMFVMWLLCSALFIDGIMRFTFAAGGTLTHFALAAVFLAVLFGPPAGGPIGNAFLPQSLAGPLLLYSLVNIIERRRAVAAAFAIAGLVFSPGISALLSLVVAAALAELLLAEQPAHPARVRTFRAAAGALAVISLVLSVARESPASVAVTEIVVLPAVVIAVFLAEKLLAEERGPFSELFAECFGALLLVSCFRLNFGLGVVAALLAGGAAAFVLRASHTRALIVPALVAIVLASGLDQRSYRPQARDVEVFHHNAVALWIREHASPFAKIAALSPFRGSAYSRRSIVEVDFSENLSDVLSARSGAADYVVLDTRNKLFDTVLRNRLMTCAEEKNVLLLARNCRAVRRS